MAGYCTLVLYFHLPAAHENPAAHSCNTYPAILPSHSSNIYIGYRIILCNDLISLGIVFGLLLLLLLLVLLAILCFCKLRFITLARSGPEPAILDWSGYCEDR